MLEKIIQRLWDTEGCLNANSRETAMDIDDKQCLKVLGVGTKTVSWKYKVPMLWKKIDRRQSNKHDGFEKAKIP